MSSFRKKSLRRKDVNLQVAVDQRERESIVAEEGTPAGGQARREGGRARVSFGGHEGRGKTAPVMRFWLRKRPRAAASPLHSLPDCDCDCLFPGVLRRPSRRNRRATAGIKRRMLRNRSFRRKGKAQLAPPQMIIGREKERRGERAAHPVSRE